MLAGRRKKSEEEEEWGEGNAEKGGLFPRRFGVGFELGEVDPSCGCGVVRLPSPLSTECRMCLIALYLSTVEMAGS